MISNFKVSNHRPFATRNIIMPQKIVVWCTTLNCWCSLCQVTTAHLESEHCCPTSGAFLSLPHKSTSRHLNRHRQFVKLWRKLENRRNTYPIDFELNIQHRGSIRLLKGYVDGTSSFWGNVRRLFFHPFVYPWIEPIEPSEEGSMGNERANLQDSTAICK